MEVQFRTVDLVVLSLVFSFALLPGLFRWFTQRFSLSYSNQLESKAGSGRPFGEWTSVPYKYPHISPHPKGRVEDIDALVYRPFKWGPHYNVTMDIKSLNFAEWFELDREFGRYFKIRKRRIEENKRRILRVLGDRKWLDIQGKTIKVRGAAPAENKTNGLAVVELLNDVVDYLCQRYPLNFALSSSERLVTTVNGEQRSYSIPSREAKVDEETAKDLLEIAALLTQDDLILMQEGSDGRYYLQGGIMCNAGSWRLQDKIGMHLEDIHVSGHVPRFREKLKVGMEKFFQRLSVDKPVSRCNWGIQQVPENHDQEDVDAEELAWSTLSLGKEEDFGSAESNHQRPDAELESLRLRVERQTLRRLPGSGTVIFGIRTYFTPVADIKGEDGARLRSAIESWPTDVATYKGWGGELYKKLVALLL
ncbi:hypothetical protein DL96DRAFT_1785695 [Flagelloscypha sp. PMI_526]|nr:hypothetical protein DL96DRAFT_1785695 [Flagelloscypha sp. PMI_526]